jgi:hypothetical protein
LEALRQLQRFYADFVPNVLPKMTVETKPNRPDRAPPKISSELEDLKTAMQEYEESKGDWSKSR